MEEENIFRHIFFREFVRGLIKNTNPADIEIEKQKLEIEPPKEHFPMQKSPRLPLRKQPFPVAQSKQNAPQQDQGQMQQSLKADPQNEADLFPRPQAGKPMILGENEEENNMNKMTTILSDPRVQSIECPGPNKRLLVRKNGIVQATKITLNKKEIKRVINDFSEKTRIPLVNGLLKAASGNLIMTAVASEYVGSRFILQKKNAFPTL